jgi:hypothetical protein
MWSVEFSAQRYHPVEVRFESGSSDAPWKLSFVAPSEARPRKQAQLSQQKNRVARRFDSMLQKLGAIVR